ncbi:glycosyl hydrolase family 79 C-terminal domain-containing protein [Dactylosporangium sp. NPDC049140]|uniref:glycosyl hydrolase family 79 C-terminal domain-containing protein n=1 Tax=Dactylosporangium sp. NPDC049140 TaxID=3155647 RepID=UPI003404910F
MSVQPPEVFIPGRPGRTPPLWLIAAVIVLTLLCTSAAAAWGSLGGPEAAALPARRLTHSAPASASPSPSRTPPAIPGGADAAVVAVDRNAPGNPLPANALGLSYEADQLAVAPGFDPVQGNLKNLLHTLGTGNLKVGANAVDSYVLWNPNNDPVPSWAKTPIGPAEIDRLAALSAATGWPVELAVNLAHLDEARIADEARYAATRLGPHLLAMECGNEPNGYPGRVRDGGWGYQQYLSDFDTCARAISGAGVRVAGPNTYNNTWIDEFARDRHAKVAYLTDQPYSLSQHNSPGHTVEELLSPNNARDDLQNLGQPLAAARKYGLALRHDETNSVNLGGLPGVSNVYGAALWGVDYSLMLLQAGLSGLNFHGTIGVCDQPEQDMNVRVYTPLCAATEEDRRAGRLTPRPLYYGMLMVALMGTGTFLRTTVNTGHNLTTYAVHGSDGKTRVMLVNKEATTAAPVTVTLSTGAAPGAKASVIRLAGTALNSPANITVAGATVRPDGTFVQGPAESATTTTAGVTLTVPGGSAALITLA